MSRRESIGKRGDGAAEECHLYTRTRKQVAVLLRLRAQSIFANALHTRTFTADCLSRIPENTLSRAGPINLALDLPSSHETSTVTGLQVLTTNLCARPSYKSDC
jgi:hypothetical protein